MRKKSNFVFGKFDGLIQLFYAKFNKTLIIELSKRSIVIHTDGTVYITQSLSEDLKPRGRKRI